MPPLHFSLGKQEKKVREVKRISTAAKAAETERKFLLKSQFFLGEKELGFSKLFRTEETGEIIFLVGIAGNNSSFSSEEYFIPEEGFD